MSNMPVGYYDRFDSSKEFDRHLFRAGYGLQSAELNEIQQAAIHRAKTIGDALFKDGDIVKDCACVINSDTGGVSLSGGAVYLSGMVRGVAPATFIVPIIGNVSVGLRLIESVVTDLEDPTLLDPASGTRNYQQPGAVRLKVEAVWAWDGDHGVGDFYSVYGVVDGSLLAKESPPSFDAVSQEIARYDRDSSGGTYIVSDLNVRMLPDEDNLQVYSIASGRARIDGRGVEIKAALRMKFDPESDLRFIDSEPHLSTTAGAQRINFDYTPVDNITGVHITSEKTVAMTHGGFVGAQDLLPDSAVLAIISVTQSGTTYVQGTDYRLTGGKVDWSPAGAEVAPGSTYNVKYQYITAITPTSLDGKGCTVTGALVGTLILVSYNQFVPRKDIIIMDATGDHKWIKGIAAEVNARAPIVPPSTLHLATITQTWDASRVITNDGVRVVPMSDIADLSDRLDSLLSMVARQQLESNIHTRESGTKKGLFVDPFLDDSQRDAGIAQSAATFDGVLTLAINATAAFVSADITKPATLNKTNVVGLKQGAITGVQKINPYMTFVIPDANVVLSPAVDRFVNVISNVTSNVTQYFYSWSSKGYLVSVSVSKTTSLTSKTIIPDANLRVLPIQFSLSGFGPGETLTSVKFGSVPVTPV